MCISLHKQTSSACLNAAGEKTKQLESPALREMSRPLEFLLVCACGASLRSGDPPPVAVRVCKDGSEVSDGC